MTEQMIRQEIEANEQRIISSFSNLTAAAKNVGYDGCRAAQSARENGLKIERNGYKKKYIIIYIMWFSITLMISFVGGSISFGVNLFYSLLVAFVPSILFIIFITNPKEWKETLSRYDSMVDTVEKQREVLDSTLENSRKI